VSTRKKLEILPRVKERGEGRKSSISYGWADRHKESQSSKLRALKSFERDVSLNSWEDNV